MCHTVRLTSLLAIVAAIGIGCTPTPIAVQRHTEAQHTDVTFVAAPQTPAAAVARVAQPVVAPPVGQRPPTDVHVDLETRQVVGALADGVPYSFWTFNGSVPGPMIRV